MNIIQKMIDTLIDESIFKDREYDVTTDWIQVRLQKVMTPLIAKYGDSFLSDKDIYTLVSENAKDEDITKLATKYPELDSVADELSLIITDLMNI